MHEDQTLGVHDINHAAFLLTRGHRIARISREGSVVCWHFKDQYNVAARDIQDFINGDAWGDCKQFSDALKTLKQTLRTN